MARHQPPPFPVDDATAAALDLALHHQSALLSAHINALAIFTDTPQTTIARAPALWQAASPDAPDLILTINPAHWHSLSRDARAASILHQLNRVTPILISEKPSRNYLGRTELRISQK